MQFQGTATGKLPMHDAIHERLHFELICNRRHSFSILVMHYFLARMSLEDEQLFGASSSPDLFSTFNTVRMDAEVKAGVWQSLMSPR